MKTLDKILLILGVFIALFIITMIVIFCIYQSIPDTLVVAVLGSGGCECVMCALITLGKKKWRIKDQYESDE